MTYVIVSGCCNDASCVDVCPVDCIHPAPGETGFATAEMLYIDSVSCIDCGACVEACPVDAIRPDTDRSPEVEEFALSAEAYFDAQRQQTARDRADVGSPPQSTGTAPGALQRIHAAAGLKVAIVGAGAAGGYAARFLLEHGAEVRLFDESLTPGGLVRFGVAPDHAATKQIQNALPYGTPSDAIQMFLGVKVGRDISHDELLAFNHYVIYANGAGVERRLSVPQVSAPNIYTAGEFVRWYNGDPKQHGKQVDVSGQSAVVVGNGNVALDIARVLLGDLKKLALTDISDEAIEALRVSKIRTVHILGRRGLAEAAYSASELIRLLNWSGEVSIQGCTLDVLADRAARASLEINYSHVEKQKIRLGEKIAAHQGTSHDRRVAFRWLVSPLELGPLDGRITLAIGRNSLKLTGDGLIATYEQQLETLTTDLVITSLGSVTDSIPSVPLDLQLGRIPNMNGRVVDAVTGEVMDRVYVAGWAKRGSRGGLGVNRSCARETVAHLLDDDCAGERASVKGDRFAIASLLRARQVHYLDASQWHRLDRLERADGERAGRPRVKRTSRESILNELDVL